MELPYNTVFSNELLQGSLHVSLADWDTKRAWHQYAFEQLDAAGYTLSSAYTMVKKDKNCRFVYRDAVWHGTDMIGAGVASFSHMSGIHFQNVSGWNEYMGMLANEQLPLGRAFVTSPREILTREMILQLKLGEIRKDYFEKKFNTDILLEFGAVYRDMESRGLLTIENGTSIRLTKTGLLQVDQLLPEFYDRKYQNSRYT